MQKRHIFQRVKSAGAFINADFLKEIESQSLQSKRASLNMKNDAIAAIAGGPSYFQTIDFPKEKDTILERMHNSPQRGVIKRDFENHHHILCFGKQTFKTVEKLRDVAISTATRKIPVHVHHIKECEWYSPKDDRSEESWKAMLKVNGQIKIVIKTFLQVTFGWTKPPIAIVEGEWRTAMQVADKEQRDTLMKDGDALVKRIWAKKGCRVYCTPETQSTWLVSVAGPKGKLVDAQKMIMG